MLIRGPFTIKWGDNEINDIEEISIEHEVDSEDYQTIQGTTIEVDGSYKANATITLLASDIAALSAVMPQYFVPNGGTMSTGETVNNADGAMDIRPGACDESLINNPLDIISCANPGQVLRLVNVRSRVDSVELDNKLLKFMVKFIGEPLNGEATMQVFKQGTINVVS